MNKELKIMNQGKRNNKMDALRHSSLHNSHFIVNGSCDGYIAIATAIIISIVLLGLISALSFSMYFTRFNVYDSFVKERSRALAESCADIALLKFRTNSSYGGGETIVVGGNECVIEQFEFSGGQTIIYTHASVQNIATRIRIMMGGGAAPVIISWKEIP